MKRESVVGMGENMQSTQSVVILDDEESTHKKWEQKLSQLNQETKILAFKKPSEFQNWFDEKINFSGYTFFFDSDLGSNEESGEQLIHTLGINSLSFLVQIIIITPS